MLDEEINQSTNGTFIKLKEEGDFFDLEVVNAEPRDRRDPQGNVVMSKKGNPRKVYRFEFADEGDGVQLYEANESAWDSIRQAIRDAGGKLEKGGRLKHGIKEKTGQYEQDKYQSRYTPPTKTAIPDAEVAKPVPAEDDSAPPF